MSDETIGGKAPGAIFWHALRASVASRQCDGEVLPGDTLDNLPPFDALTPDEKGALFDACVALLRTATQPRGGPRVRHRMLVTVNGVLVADQRVEHAWDFSEAKAPLQVEVVMVEDQEKPDGA